MWLTHREELVTQGAASLARLGVPHGIVKAGRPSNPNAPIQVCSVQTLAARPHEIPPCDICVVDETHHVVARTWRESLDVMKARRGGDLELVLGLTATPERSDGSPLGDIYEHMVAVTSVAELQAAGILVPIRVEGPGGYQKELFREHIEGLKEFGSRPDGSIRPFLLFCASVEESAKVAERGRQAGIRVESVDGKTDAARRADIFASLAAGELDGVTNVFVATEGFDCPRVEVVGIARGCAAESTFIQMLGRGARSCPGKAGAVFIDYRGLSHVHGLFEEPRTFSLEGKAIKRAEKAKLRKCQSCGALVAPKPTCSSCGHVHVVEAQEQGVRRSKAVTITADVLTPQHVKKAFYDELVATCTAKGYKLGWVGYQFQQRFGYWPPWLAGLIRMRARGGRAA